MSLTIADRPVGPIGFGMGGLTSHLKQPPIQTQDAIDTLKAALDAGANCWNAGTNYGTPEYNSLHLLNAYFTKYPEDADKVVVSVKSCFEFGTGIHVDAQSVRDSIEHCLKVIDGKCRIDVFQAARLDPNVPVEETVGAIAEYLKAGKIGGVGLSECSVESIKQAVAVTPIAAVEVEVSMFETGIFRNGIAEACKKNSIPIVAYSPLNRGFLSGQIRRQEDLPEKDFRHMMPRWQADAFDHNFKLVEEAEKVAKQKGCSSVQVALAWVVAQTESVGVPVIPIPGASSISRLRENMESVMLSDEELKGIDEVLEKTEVKGGRAPAQFTKYLEV